MQTMSDNNFWFGRPKLLLTILQYIMFDNASSVAFAVFEAWQVGSFGHCFATWPAIAARLVVALLCLLHGGFVILPVRSAKAGQTSFSCLPSSVRNTF